MVSIYLTYTISLFFYSFLAKRSVKDEIINFDARKITKEVRISVQKILQAKAASFDPVNAKRASTIAAPLAEWVKANLMYSEVLEKIAPLEKEQQALLK